MKKLLILFAFALTAFAAQSQSVARWGMIPYSSRVPTSDPAIHAAQVWYNTDNGTLYTYNRTTREWEAAAKAPAYGEISISNDTASISFAATTAAPIEDLTAGLLNDFSLVGDSAIRYDGEATGGRFLLNYSTSVSFAEAANILNVYPIINTTAVLRCRSRQTAALTTDRVEISGSCIVALAPDDTVRLMAVPSAHTGTDVLTIYEANLNLVQLK